MDYNATVYDENEDLEKYRNFESIIQIALPIIFAFITLLGLLGNGLVIWTILTNTKVRTPTNILILNLAVTDFLFIAICVPFTGAGNVLPKYIFGRVWCKISQYFIYVCACVSIYSLVLMSVVRCIVVVRPLSSQSLVTTRRVCTAVAAIWIVILGGFTPLLRQYDVVTYTYFGEDRSTCFNVEVNSSGTIRETFYAMFFTFGYALPFYIMIILYGIILATLKCGAKHTKTIEVSTKRNRSNDRVTKMVVAVIFCFLVCWLPIQVIFMLQTFGKYKDTVTGILVQMLANCLAYFNSCMNPILYAFLSSQFRISFKQALCCGRLSVIRPGLRSSNLPQGEIQTDITDNV